MILENKYVPQINAVARLLHLQKMARFLNDGSPPVPVLFSTFILQQGLSEDHAPGTPNYWLLLIGKPLFRQISGAPQHVLSHF